MQTNPSSSAKSTYGTYDLSIYDKMGATSLLFCVVKENANEVPLRYPASSSPTKRLPHLPTAATRSPRCIRHRRCSDRSPSSSAISNKPIATPAGVAFLFQILHKCKINLTFAAIYYTMYVKELYILEVFILENRIKQLRKEQGITQDELANALSVTRQTVISLENGKYNPSLQLAFKIAKYFKKEIEHIFIFQEG